MTVRELLDAIAAEVGGIADDVEALDPATQRRVAAAWLSIEGARQQGGTHLARQRATEWADRLERETA